jgi:hypothetical protein
MMTLAEINQELHILEARLRLYEHKYGMASANFYALYQQGQLDDEGFEQSLAFTPLGEALIKFGKNANCYKKVAFYEEQTSPWPQASIKSSLRCIR